MDIIWIGVIVGGALYAHKYYGPQMDSVTKAIETCWRNRSLK